MPGPVYVFIYWLVTYISLGVNTAFLSPLIFSTLPFSLSLSHSVPLSVVVAVLAGIPLLSLIGASVYFTRNYCKKRSRAKALPGSFDVTLAVFSKGLQEPVTAHPLDISAVSRALFLDELVSCCKHVAAKEVPALEDRAFKLVRYFCCCFCD